MAKRRPLPIVEMLRSLLREAPFVGIIVRTSDGESFRISHPEYVLIGPQGDLVTCYDDDQHPHHLNGRQIVSVEPDRPKKQPPTSRSGGRG